MTKPHRPSLYYEAHVTIDPVDDKHRSIIQTLAKPYGFRMAKLLMRKPASTDVAEHRDDAFLTARNTKWGQIASQTSGLVKALKEAGYGVRRYKIEDTLIDSKISDDLLLGVGHDMTAIGEEAR
jgi:hypothetical protein